MADLPKKLPQAEAVPVPVWDGDDYDSAPPGEYTATIVRVGVSKWLRRYKRWCVVISYDLDSGEQVPGYYSLGENPSRPTVGRRSRYWSLYEAALGKQPEPGAMPPEMLRGKRVRIKVTDSKDGRYSLVTAESAPDSASESSSASESLSASMSLSMSVSESMSVSGNQAQAQAQAAGRPWEDL